MCIGRPQQLQGGSKGLRGHTAINLLIQVPELNVLLIAAWLFRLPLHLLFQTIGSICNARIEKKALLGIDDKKKLKFAKSFFLVKNSENNSKKNCPILTTDSIQYWHFKLFVFYYTHVPSHHLLIRLMYIPYRIYVKQMPGTHTHSWQHAHTGTYSGTDTKNPPHSKESSLCCTQ